MDNQTYFRESLRFLQQTEPANWIFIVAGSVAIVTGFLSLTIVLKNKQLRTTFHLLYIGVAFDDIIMGCGYIIIGAARHFFYVRNIGDVQTRWMCCWEAMVLYFSQTLGLYMAATLAVDRLLSLVVPLKYKYMKPHLLALPLIAGALAMSLFETVYMMFQGRYQREVLISCGTGSCWSRFSYVITLYAHLALSFVVVSTNFALIVMIRRLLDKAKKNKTNGWLEQARSNLQVDGLKTLTIVIVSHGSSHISTRLGLLFLWYVSDQEPELTLLGMILRNLVVINAASHFFIYYATNCEFRSGTKKWFRRATTCFGGAVANSSVIGETTLH